MELNLLNFNNMESFIYRVFNCKYKLQMNINQVTKSIFLMADIIEMRKIEK